MWCFLAAADLLGVEASGYRLGMLSLARSCWWVVTGLVVLFAPAVVLGQPVEAGDAEFERFRLASVPLPGTVDEVIVDEEQALEVFLSPSDFPDALVRLTLEGARADFAMNLDFATLSGEALPHRVQWPTLGGRELEVTAPETASKGIRLQRPSTLRSEAAEKLADQELRLEWFVKPEEGNAGGALRGRVQALRLTTKGDSSVTLSRWIAMPQPSGCVESIAKGPRCRAPGISRSVTSLSVDPSGRWLAVSGGDLRPRVDIWDLTSFELQRRVSFPPWQGPPAGAAFTADGRYLLVADAAGFIHRWDAVTGGRHRAFEVDAHAFDVLDAGRLVAVSGARGGLTLWRIGDGTIAARLGRVGGEPSHRLVASPDGMRLAEQESADGAVQITVWDMSEQRVVGRIGGVSSGLVDLVLDGQGGAALASHDERGVLRARVENPSSWSDWGGAVGRGCRGSLVVSPDGSRLACAMERGAALFDLETGQVTQQLSSESSDGELGELVFTPDGERLIGARGDELVAWDLVDELSVPRRAAR